MSELEDYALTLDIDWAPDFVIDEVAAILIERQVKATWFVTHHSEAVERLREHSGFELGIHPNMLPGSTHGTSEVEVLDHMGEIVPEAVSMRTHGLYQSSGWLIRAARDHGIRVDASLFLPRASHLQAHCIRWHGVSLWRIPYFWEDDGEMFEEDPIWSVTDERLGVSGLRVFDFHPIHVALNTDRFERYSKLKALRPVHQWDEKFVQDHVRGGSGPRAFFIELADCLRGMGKTVSELVPSE